ncbi:hypothetical protein EIP86_006451 [Pleurotus ostreatoroseus]|nr:hypothetical protein EIP86_006451 [Pleurotus ostreatoroseus]
MQAVVIGGGLLGLEAAKALYDLETVKNVTIIHRQMYPLSRQLDAAGGEIVLRRIEALGVNVVGNVSPRSLVTRTDQGKQVLTGVELNDGSVIPCTVAVFSIGIQPRDELAAASGIACEGAVSPKKHGIIVDDYLRTSADDIYAIGECASWNGKTYGLIAPGIEMADILSFNLTQTQTDNNPDLSTKLKLVGVDVASFGDYFADSRRSTHTTTSQQAVTKPSPATSVPLSHNQRDPFKPKIWELTENKSPESDSLITTKASDGAQSADKATNNASSPRKRHGHGAAAEGPVETLTYRDPFSGVYKKYIFSADGKYILGGMMVGDTSDYVKLLALVKKKKALEVPPSQFIVGSGNSDDSGADLDDDTQICSCHNVNKGQIAACVRNGATTLADIKTKTKAGTGCGGCMTTTPQFYLI